MADFEVSIRALPDDPDQGIIGARGANNGEVQESDYAHVRTWLKGALIQLESAFPSGWELEVVSLADAHTQTAFTGNVRRAPAPTELPLDRLAQVEEGVCANCGRPIASQGDDVWYHLQPCVDPEPAEEGAVRGDGPSD